MRLSIVILHVVFLSACTFVQKKEFANIDEHFLVNFISSHELIPSFSDSIHYDVFRVDSTGGLTRVSMACWKNKPFSMVKTQLDFIFNSNGDFTCINPVNDSPLMRKAIMMAKQFYRLNILHFNKDLNGNTMYTIQRYQEPVLLEITDSIGYENLHVPNTTAKHLFDNYYLRTAYIFE